MSDRNDPIESTEEAFEILNEEFSRHDLEQENIRHLETVSRRQSAPQPQRWTPPDDFIESDDEDEEKSGCVGSALKILLILILAGALAWMIFMPSGSLSELWEKIGNSVSGAYSWAVGMVDGSGSGAAAQPDDDADYVDDNWEPDEDAEPVDDDPEASDQPVAGNNGIDVEPSQDGYRVTVYRPSQIVIVYDSGGNPVKTFSCSSGKSSTPTKLGEYAIRAKYRWRFMVGNCYTQYASSFSNGYLFHSIPYNKKNPATMSNASYDKLGNPASSGCIRLCFRDTKWIYDNCPIGTKVSVVDENAPAGSVPEIIPERIKDKAHSGWDPTDESPDNPYNN